MKLFFSEPDHRYELEGIRVRSVTNVLQKAGIIDFSSIPPGTLEEARTRGTTVHKALHYYNEHDLNIDEFRQDFPSYVGYVDAWISFCEQRHFVPVLSEHRVASPRHLLAGTLDCLGLLDGVGVLLDFSTGRPQDVGKNLQTAAYHALALEWASEDPSLEAFVDAHPVIKRFAVALRRDGTFRLESYNDPTDFRKFLTLLEAQRIVEAHRGVEVAA